MQKLYYILCFFFVVHETWAGRVQNCACSDTGDKHCENRDKYGHRRALVQTADLDWGNGISISFGSEFDTLRDQAEQLSTAVVKSSKKHFGQQKKSNPNVASFGFVFLMGRDNVLRYFILGLTLRTQM